MVGGGELKHLNRGTSDIQETACRRYLFFAYLLINNTSCAFNCGSFVLELIYR